jgi:hypothetical protein
MVTIMVIAYLLPRGRPPPEPPPLPIPYPTLTPTILEDRATALGHASLRMTIVQQCSLETTHSSRPDPLKKQFTQELAAHDGSHPIFFNPQLLPGTCSVAFSQQSKDAPPLCPSSEPFRPHSDSFSTERSSHQPIFAPGHACRLLLQDETHSATLSDFLPPNATPNATTFMVDNLLPPSLELATNRIPTECSDDVLLKRLEPATNRIPTECSNDVLRAIARCVSALTHDQARTRSTYQVHSYGTTSASRDPPSLSYPALRVYRHTPSLP